MAYDADGLVGKIGLEQNVPAKKGADGTTNIRHHLSEKLMERGAKLRKRMDFACAVGLLDQALSLHPQNVSAFLERGEAYYQSRDFGRAAANWERAASMDATLRNTLDPRVQEARRKAGS